MKALIVDDEPLARKVLREELELVADVDVRGEADSGETAVTAIRVLQPDIVFLDLQMPGMSGFDVVRQLRGGVLPVVVIVTAYDRHAIEAFEAGAIDYLLKPISVDRLHQSLDRARRLTRNRGEVAESLVRLEAASNGRAPQSRPRKIVGRAGEEYFLLDQHEVLAFQADREVVWIVTARRKYQATATLRDLQSKLEGSTFQRIHRNALVNVNHVRKMAALTSQRWLLTLDNDHEFIVSKRQAKNVRELLSW